MPRLARLLIPFLSVAVLAGSLWPAQTLTAQNQSEAPRAAATDRPEVSALLPGVQEIRVFADPNATQVAGTLKASSLPLPALGIADTLLIYIEAAELKGWILPYEVITNFNPVTVGRCDPNERPGPSGGYSIGEGCSGDAWPEQEPMPAAGEDPFSSGNAPQPQLSSLRHTGRDLLFPGEDERPGHPLYSYLLFTGASDGDREELARFRVSIEAYVGQISSADALVASGAQRGEINIFYAPMTALFADTTAANMRIHFAQRSPAEQVTLLLDHYDRARAEVLLGRLRLAGNGPYIVSVLRPLSRGPVATDEAFLVQDLSGVPPELVALWVDEFKRQVVQEATDSPEHLRRFALNLRTQIAVLAEAFSITKSAVADMFEQPKPAGGSGN